MIGTKITAAISITPSVVWLEDASQTVRLLRGIEGGRQDEGEHADPRRRHHAGDAEGAGDPGEAVPPAAPGEGRRQQRADDRRASGASMVQGMAL